MENIAGGQFKAEVVSPPVEDRLLDPKNFIDKEILHYIRHIQNDTAPTQTEQRNLVKSIHQKNKTAVIDLINLNKGLISSIAYALNTPDFDTSVDTIPAGVRALLNAAATYDFKISKTSFTNYAIPQIHQAMEEVVASVELPYIFENETPPLYTIYKYLSTLKKRPESDTDADLDPENIQVNETAGSPDSFITLINPLADEQTNESDMLSKDEILTGLTTTEKKVVPYLHLPKSEIMRNTGMRNATIQMIISRLTRRTQTTNQQDLALLLYTEGFMPIIPTSKVPFEEMFHPLQIEVLQNLHLTKQELTARFSLPEHSISPLIRDALIVTGARTTTELLLMAYEYGQQNNFTSKQRDENAS